MGYAIPKDPRKYYDWIKTKKQWLKVIDYELSEDRKRLLKECIIRASNINENAINILANLLHYATDDEVFDNWILEQQYMAGTVKRPPSGSSYRNLQHRYGEQEARRIYSRLQEERSKKAKNSFKNNTTYWINLGYSEEDAQNLVKEEQSKRSKKRWSKFQTSEERSVECRKQNPLCKEYYSSELSSDEVQTRIEEHGKLGFSVRGFDDYIELYGVEEGTRKLKERSDKRKATMLENESGYFSSDKGMASKESLKVLEPIANWVLDLGISAKDIYLGTPEYQGERWVRSDDWTEFYLYDLTILPLNVIIEYHGVEWHPKPDCTWALGYTPLNESAYDKRQHDLRKKELAEERGFQVLEIWSDESTDTLISKCKEFINEQRNNLSQSTS